MKPNDSAYYAGLVKQLRFIDEDTLNIEPYSCEQLCKSAADALEAVLAEREALMAVNAEFSVVFKERDDAIAERDALAARLAPVEGEALVEIVAKHFIKENKKSPYTCWKKAARDAIAAIRPHIEAAERERCAMIAERKKKQKYYDPNSIGWEGEWEIVDEFPKDGKEIAAAIRSGK